MVSDLLQVRQLRLLVLILGRCPRSVTLRSGSTSSHPAVPLPWSSGPGRNMTGTGENIDVPAEDLLLTPKTIVVTPS